MQIIGHIHSSFPSKFGIPRQSGITESLKAYITFDGEFRNADCVRGLSEYTHIWVIWEFSENKDSGWSPTVRPPRLGGNKRMGVFATRSPFRPNPIGLSSVKLDSIEVTEEYGPVIHVSGADLMDGTPILDIKPYIMTDCHPDAVCGFADRVKDYELEVSVDERMWGDFPVELRVSLVDILSQDPRPSYQNDPERLYGFEYAGYEIKFRVENRLLTVCDITTAEEQPQRK